MKYRNEIILAVCFIAGNVIASWPADVTDYAERSEMQARTARAASVSRTTDRLLAHATSPSGTGPSRRRQQNPNQPNYIAGM